MRTRPTVQVTCDNCNKGIEIKSKLFLMSLGSVDEELERMDWTYAGNLDFCPDCKNKVYEYLEKSYLYDPT